MVKDQKKKRGVFLTGFDIASYLVKRVLKGYNQKILEPSFGDGVFIDSVISHFIESGNSNKVKDDLYGVEIRQEAIDQYKHNTHIDPAKFLLTDFLDTEPFSVDLVLGNPPYVSLNNVDVEERNKALRILDRFKLIVPLNGSLWFPFLLHSISHLSEGGGICFVLPFEMTYVKYSRELWHLLGKRFSSLTIIRVFEDIFPDVDVETILFIANGFGGSTNLVDYEIYQDKTKLINNEPIKITKVSIDEIREGKRPFITGVLGKEHIDLINNIYERNIVQQISKLCKFKIGYVSADKIYFHPDNILIEKFALSEDVLLPAIINAKILRNKFGLRITKNSITTHLFYPIGNTLDTGTQRYIEYGEDLGVHERYKCRNRKPWYVTPGIEYPNIILTVFGDRPRLYVNEGMYAASNSLLCGFLQNGVMTEDIAASWYNSFTLLSIEMKVHSLGGGVLVFIPGETDVIEVVDTRAIEKKLAGFINEVDSLLKSNCLDAAYALGDKMILGSLGLSDNEIEIIRDAVRILRSWRNAKHKKKNEE